MKIRITRLFTALATLLMFTGCAGKLFYYPTREIYQTPARKGLTCEEVTFRSSDGTELSGWFLPAKGDARGTVIHFHGNAQNMTAHLSFVDWLPAEGFNVFVFDYRGYGRSAGEPDREGVYNDCLAAIQYVCRRRDVDRDKLILLGQSLGAANAIAVLGENKFSGIRAIAVDSPFYSYTSIARDKIADMSFLWLFKWPLCFIATGNSHSPAASIGNIAPVPLLIMHGTRDEVIPFHHSEWLYERARQPKVFLKVEGGTHTSGLISPAQPYRGILVDFFKNALE